MELTYRKEGDFLLPNLEAPESPKIGKYGMLRLRYLREHRRAILTGLQMTGKLNAHLEQIDREAMETVNRLTAEMAKTQGVNEQMKGTDQMMWVGMMNSLRASAEEIVFRELIYV